MARTPRTPVPPLPPAPMNADKRRAMKRIMTSLGVPTKRSKALRMAQWILIHRHLSHGDHEAAVRVALGSDAGIDAFYSSIAPPPEPSEPDAVPGLRSLVNLLEEAETALRGNSEHLRTLADRIRRALT